MKVIKLLGVATLAIGILFSSVACEQKSTEELPIAEEQNDISLQFKDYTSDDNFNEIDENKIVETIEQYTINDINYIIFVYENDTNNLHSGVIIDNKIYEFQKVSMMEDKNNNDLFSVSEIELYDKQLVKIQGILGANYAPTNYYYIENQSPQLFLHSEGHTVEVDLDNDGTQEIISTITGGVTTEIEIYKYSNGNLFVANLNEALNAISIIYNRDNKVFEAYFKDKPNQPMFYEFTKDGLKELQSN